MLAFGATALVAFYEDPVLGGYLLAFALLGHAAWDAYHYLRNRIVPRSYAELCAGFDRPYTWAICRDRVSRPETHFPYESCVAVRRTLTSSDTIFP
jgi:hypothetical protein